MTSIVISNDKGDNTYTLHFSRGRNVELSGLEMETLARLINATLNPVAPPRSWLKEIEEMYGMTRVEAT